MGSVKQGNFLQFKAHVKYRLWQINLPLLCITVIGITSSKETNSRSSSFSEQKSRFPSHYICTDDDDDE